MSDSLELSINARRHFAVQRIGAPEAPVLAVVSRIERAFAQGQGAGLVHYASTEVTTVLPPAEELEALPLAASPIRGWCASRVFRPTTA